MTSNRLTYAVVIILLALFYIYCDSYMPLIIMIIVFCSPLFTFVFGLLASRKISASVKAVSKSTLPDNEVKLAIVLENNSFIPVSAANITVEIESATDSAYVKRKIRTAVSAKETESVYIGVSSRHCTVLNCRIKKARCCDAFGLFSYKIRIDKAENSIVIMPKTLKNGLNISKSNYSVVESDTYSETQKGDDSSQVFEVRDYVPGDDIRRIHWRLSSKQDSLIVKEFSRPIADKCVVLLESGLISGSAEDSCCRIDKILSAFITLADGIINLEQSISVQWYSAEKEILLAYDVHSREEIYSVIKLFLCEKFSDKASVSINNFKNYNLLSSEIYYIYDSGFSSINNADYNDSGYLFVDIGQVDVLVK